MGEMLLYKEVSFSTKPLYATPSDKVLWIGDKRIVLRDFQARVYEEISKRRNERVGIFLEAPTGSGKTYIQLMLLGIKDYHGVVGIYPNKTLAKDQYDSLYNVLEGGEEVPLREIGIERSIEELLGDKTMNRYFEEKLLPKNEREFITLRNVKVVNPVGEELTRKVLLILLTSETVEVLRLLLNKETKREAFLELVNNIFLKVDFVIVLTVPEYPYTFLEMSYGEFESEGEKLWRAYQHYKEFLEALAGSGTSTDVSELINEYIKKLESEIISYRHELGVTRGSLIDLLEIYAGLFRYPLFVDEFHSYDDLSELSLVALLFMYYASYPYAKVIYSSATPNERLRKLIEVLHRLFKVETVMVRAETRDEGEQEHLIRGRSEVHFYGVSTLNTGIPGLLKAQSFVPEVARSIAGKDPNKKTMVILDRIGLVLDTCMAIRKAVGEDKNIAYVTSVKVPTEYCREVNIESLRGGGYDYIVGNLALAQGIDLKDMERSIIYAKDVMSFIQRFGRVPRGRDGEVYVVVEWSRLERLKDLEGRELSYHDFIDYITKHRVFPNPAENTWLRTRLGFVKLTFPIFAYTLRWDVAYRDRRGTSYDVLREILPKLSEFIQEYFGLFNLDKNTIGHLKLLLSRTTSSRGLESGVDCSTKDEVDYTTFYKLMSFRDIPSVKMEVISSKGKFVREQPLVATLRNFLVEGVPKDGSVVLRVNLEKRGFFIPWLLAEEEFKGDEERILGLLEPLDDCVTSFILLLDILSKSKYSFELVQLDRYSNVKSPPIILEELRDKIAGSDLARTPVLLRVRKQKESDDFEDYALFMANTREALPIGIYKRGLGAKPLGLTIFI